MGEDGRPVDVGSRIKVLSHEITIVGIYEPSQLARVKIPLATLQQLLGGVNNCTFVMIRVEPGMTDQVLKTLKEMYPGNNFIRTSDLPELFSQSSKPVEVFLDVVIGLALVISTLVILLRCIRPSSSAHARSELKSLKHRTVHRWSNRERGRGHKRAWGRRGFRRFCYRQIRH